MRLMLATVSIFLLGGCASLTGTVATNKAACTVWPNISWSQKDTDQTIREVKVSNARREAFCKD